LYSIIFTLQLQSHYSYVLYSNAYKSFSVYSTDDLHTAFFPVFAFASLRFLSISIRCFNAATRESPSSLEKSASISCSFQLSPNDKDLLSTFLLFQSIHNILPLLPSYPSPPFSFTLLYFRFCLDRLLIFGDISNWRGFIGCLTGDYISICTCCFLCRSGFLSYGGRCCCWCNCCLVACRRFRIRFGE
jgi:hypothetical protein